MKRLLPNTLFGRMVLIMIVGLVAAQLLSMAIFFQERERLNLRTGARYFSARVAEIVKILDRLPAGQRATLAAEISSPELTVSLADSPVETKTGAVNDESAAIIAGRLRRHLGEMGEMRVVVVDGVDSGPAGSDAASAKRLVVQVKLSDNTWMRFSSSVSEPPGPPPSSRFVLDMGLRLVTVIILSLLAVRLVTRPLRTLASAAEELGRDIHRPPLEEKGPLEVRQAAHAFNTMQTRLVQYIRERTRILAAVSHDLKTPITRLRLRTELLRDKEIQAKFARDLEEMEAMVGATLDFTSGLEQVEPAQQLDVMALLESLQEDAQELGHDVTILGKAAGPIRTYPQSLKRCIANLLDNALKYGRRAQLVVDDSDRLLRISVRDDGPGIPDDEIKKVFEPFYRIEGSRNRSTGGAGLGLSIAMNGARANGGDITLRNRPEGGLEATLLLPRTV